jgi:hypothetical protein
MNEGRAANQSNSGISAIGHSLLCHPEPDQKFGDVEPLKVNLPASKNEREQGFRRLWLWKWEKEDSQK